jgi:acyl carrier protein phosphodiesterase
LYDHFLANDETIFTEEILLEFSCNVYDMLEQQAVHLPTNFIFILPYMKTENWLFNYRYKEGVAKSLRGLVRRSTYLSDHQTAFHLFNENYVPLKACYNEFFKDVKAFAKQKLMQLVS